jgi:hypothetical protein
MLGDIGYFFINLWETIFWSMWHQAISEGDAKIAFMF